MRDGCLVFASIALMVVLTGSAGAQTPQNVRIIADRADVLLRPEATSTVIVTLQVGTIIEVITKTGDWYEVSLPSETTGLRRIGYVKTSAAELLPGAGAVGATAGTTGATPTPASPSLEMLPDRTIQSPEPPAAGKAPNKVDDVGAVQLQLGAGLSFGLTGARACAGSVCSDERSILPAPSIQVAVKAAPRVLLFFDLTAFDSGSASVSSRGLSSSVSGSDIAFTGGIRFMTRAGRSSDLKGYAEAAFGVLHENFNATFNGVQESPASANAGLVMFGGGFEMLLSPRSGVSLGVDVGHVAGLNFTRVHSAWTFQTKPGIPPADPTVAGTPPTPVAAQAIDPAPAKQVPPNSYSSKFFVGVGGEGHRYDSLFTAGTGFGLGLVLGYGFDRHWSIYGEVGRASFAGFAETQFDIGTRIHFSSRTSRLVPFVQGAVTGLVDTFNGGTLNGRGATFGGGVNTHFSRATALSAAATWNVASFNNYLSDDVRVHLGVVWFVGPRAR